VKDVFIQMSRAVDQKGAMAEAAKAAEENRDLNERAYQEEMVETKDVIEAQLVESLMKANYEKTLYDHMDAQARLDFVVARRSRPSFMEAAAIDARLLPQRPSVQCGVSWNERHGSSSCVGPHQRRVVAHFVCLGFDPLGLLPRPWRGLASDDAKDATRPPDALNIGYSAAVLAEVDRGDATAATKMWTDRILRRKGVKGDSGVLIFGDAASLDRRSRTRRGPRSSCCAGVLGGEKPSPIVPVVISAPRGVSWTSSSCW